MPIKKKNAAQQIGFIFNRIKTFLQKDIQKDSLKPIAQFTLNLIVKRTRLGYGVTKLYGSKQKLKPLSPNYIDYRKKLAGEKRREQRQGTISLGTKTIRLSDFTRATRSNLTLTGQMLESMSILSISRGSIKIGPTGQRKEGGPSNAQVAEFQADQGRVFNKVSELEYKQILRQYRRTFGDLAKKKKIIS